MYDIIVIGSGPAGYVAAIRASQLGLKTACIEKSSGNNKPQLGGTCLNVGCIPSKALLDSSHRYADALNHFPDHGIKVTKPIIDISQMMERKNKIVSQLTSGVAGLLKANKVSQITGSAKIINSHNVEVSNEENTELLKTKNIIIAVSYTHLTLPTI